MKSARTIYVIALCKYVLLFELLPASVAVKLRHSYFVVVFIICASRAHTAALLYQHHTARAVRAARADALLMLM